jgi:Tfp pilus assembly protein PilO
MSASNRVIVAMLAVAALAVGFWMLLLSPKRAEVGKLDRQVVQQEESLSIHQQEVQRGLEAERSFPQQYQQLVVLGKAAPAEDDTASLLVQLNRIADDAGVRFEVFKLGSSGGGEETEEAAGGAETETEAGVPAPPTEVAASTMPLGASIGPAGLAAMPYSLDFKGSFFHVADFIHGLDALVRTKNAEVEVTGRLVTVDGFVLKADPNKGFPFLDASFSVTTFLVPPAQGITGGATPSSPEPAATPVATTTGGMP